MYDDVDSQYRKTSRPHGEIHRGGTGFEIIVSGR